MRITVRLKLFMIMSALILLFAVLSQLLCAFFLESYYHSSKKKELYNCLNEVNEILRGDNESIQSNLLALERNSYMSIVLTDANYDVAYSLTPTFGVAMRAVQITPEIKVGAENSIKDNVAEYHIVAGDTFIPAKGDASDQPFFSALQGEKTQPAAKRSDSTDGNEAESQSVQVTEIQIEDIVGMQTVQGVTFERYPDSMIKAWMKEYNGKPLLKDFNISRDGRGFIGLLSEIKLPDGSLGYAMIQTSIIAMESSVKAASRFLLYISLGIFTLSIPVIFLMSRSISKPIVRMSEIARNMSNLDFSQKLLVKSSDEIGELAENVNRMSFELDRTITELNNNLQLKDKIEGFRKEFIANVSHELKTPISLIGGYAEGLRFNIDECEKDYYCDVIMDETRKMNELVRSLLDLSQLEYGSAMMNKEDFDLSELTSALLSKFELVFERKGIKVESNLSEGCMVYADSIRMEQAIANYLTNAVNHVCEGGRVCVSVTDSFDCVTLSVYNDGEHIDEEHLERIWHSFYKADEARTREYGGQGLGLSIVRAVAEAHGGRCGARNSGNGVEFWLELGGSLCM